MSPPKIPGPLRNWLLIACSKPVMYRASMTSVTVGTLLALINHGSEIFAGLMTTPQWLRVALTYVVPYCVATWSSVQTTRQWQTAGTSMERSGS